eukprot:g5213.t1
MHLVKGENYRKSFQETGDAESSCWPLGSVRGGKALEERITNLFSKITNQMIVNCRSCIIGDCEDASHLWDILPPELIKNLEVCLKLNEAYQEQYNLTKSKLMTLPKGKQFDFNESLIFGRFDLFCRRVVKLIHMFGTVHQFNQLKIHLKSMDGIRQLVASFQNIVDDFKVKRHDLLDFLNNRFDRDYVEFNVRVSELESRLQEFINQSFHNIASIDTSLKLLSKFQSILQNGSLKTVPELEPAPRSCRGRLAQLLDQSRQLLHLIMDPMRRFHLNPLVLAGGKEAKRITKMYNKMAKTLVEFEIVWHQAWMSSLETTKAGLNATLMIKHPEDQKYHVNFDSEILQLMRETKIIDRMGHIDIPETHGTNRGMYQSLLAATKRSLHKVKERLAARKQSDGSPLPPIFEVELQLNGLGVCLQPSIEEIQSAVNGGAIAVLKSSKMIEPSLDEFEARLRSFARLGDEFQLIDASRQISALSLQAALGPNGAGLLNAACSAVDACGAVVARLRARGDGRGRCWERRGGSLYAMLTCYLPNILDKEEQDARSMLQSSWTRLLAESETRHLELTVKQVHFKRNLIKTVHSFKRDVEKFRRDYEERGPMVKGIRPGQAVERLKRCKEEFEVHARKRQIFGLGEDLFGLPHQSYTQLDQTEKELDYLSQLYDLYTAVLETIGRWKDYLWVDVPAQMESMKKEADQFAYRCKKMPPQLREWPAYHELKKEIEDFQHILPILMELSKKSIQQRHWQQVNDITGKDLQVEREDFKLQSLIDAKLNDFKDEILDITESADKQQIIEEKLADITALWNTTRFEFSTSKGRETPCAPRTKPDADSGRFWSRTSAPIPPKSLPDRPVQVLDWLKIMHKSAETLKVVDCCQNELLRQMLPVLLAGLETCQKSLESYLEGKRQKFPRFFFTSDPVLLKILSQGGSDPDTIQDDFEKLFDAISRVTFDKLDRRKIKEIKSVAGTSEEKATRLLAIALQEWLQNLEVEMKRSVRRDCRVAAQECGHVCAGVSVQAFADKYIAQVALLGIQLIWTADFQNALSFASREKDKSVMNATNRKFLALLQELETAGDDGELTAICLQGDLSKLKRVKYETLVTIHVHQKDLFQEVLKKPKDQRVKDENDFEWLKQTRLYWSTETGRSPVGGKTGRNGSHCLARLAC